MEKIIIGLVEKIKIGDQELLARIDTGAKSSSISTELAKKLNLGPVLRTVTIKSSNGKETRPVVSAQIEIKGRKLNTELNITERKHMLFKMLIGRNVLTKGFLIDPGDEE